MRGSVVGRLQLAGVDRALYARRSFAIDVAMRARTLSANQPASAKPEGSPMTANDSNATYPRDLAGYGATPPHPRWPGGARIALQFVLNYEEGAENSVLH